MERPKPDVSMICRVAMGDPLISRGTALAIYKLVIADCRGEAELRAQEPLGVSDGGNVWAVSGSRPIEGRETKDYAGPIGMSISKLDGAIVSFTDSFTDGMHCEANWRALPLWG
jgi:hypothetical protein